MRESLRQMTTSAPADYLGLRNRWERAQRASTARYESTMESMDALENMDEAVEMSRATEDHNDEAALAEIAELVGARGAESLVLNPDVDATSAEFVDLLGQLKVEPSDDDELGAKFGIYEHYGEEVTKLRESVFSLYNESKSTLPKTVKTDMERQLK